MEFIFTYRLQLLVHTALLLLLESFVLWVYELEVGFRNLLVV